MNNKTAMNWLLLRGLSREAAHWGEFAGQLQAAFPYAAIHTLDLPGTGTLNAIPSPCTIQEITEIVRNQALQQDLLQQPLTVLAVSMGGMVAWEWMQKYQNDINAAVLINTSFATLSPFYHRLRWQCYGKFAQILLETDIYRRELAIVQLVCNNRSRDLEIASAWQDIQLKRPISKVTSLKQIRAAASYKPSELKPKQPVLLLNSLGDRLVAQACSTAIRNKWQLEMHTHPWAGHDLSLDDGTWVTNRLQNWIERQSSITI